MVQDGPRQAQDRPKTAQDSPRQAQDSRRQAQDSPRQAQDRPKTGPRQPKTAQDSPRQAQDGPRQPKTGSRQAQYSPRQAQYRHPRASRSSVPPVTSLEPPATSLEPPASSFQQRATSNQKPNAPPRLWYLRASVPSSLKIIGTLEPRVPSSLPATSSDLPATSYQQPVAICAAGVAKRVDPAAHALACHGSRTQIPFSRRSRLRLAKSHGVDSSKEVHGSRFSQLSTTLQPNARFLHEWPSGLKAGGVSRRAWPVLWVAKCVSLSFIFHS